MVVKERCESGRIGLTANELTWETGSEGSNPSLSALRCHDHNVLPVQRAVSVSVRPSSGRFTFEPAQERLRTIREPEGRSTRDPSVWASNLVP